MRETGTIESDGEVASSGGAFRWEDEFAPYPLPGGALARISSPTGLTDEGDSSEFARSQLAEVPDVAPRVGQRVGLRPSR